MARATAIHSDHSGADLTHGSSVVIRDAGKTFISRLGRTEACHDISLDVNPGEFVVVVGPSGCGKSTLLRMIAGLEDPTTGSISTMTVNGKLALNSMVFHGRTLFPWLSLRSNVAYGIRIRGIGKSEALRRADELLDLVGLRQFHNAWPHQVSEGMRQRVSLARALAIDPQLLLMDEPFGALDEQTRYILQEELLRIWDETKKTVLFITHSVDEAVTLGDKIMVMTSHPGRTKALIDVPFERPRGVLELRARPEYGELVYKIWGYLREEVQHAKADAECAGGKS